ncbi:MAG: phosphatidylinositol kinase [Candidatus Binatia bacterium]
MYPIITVPDEAGDILEQLGTKPKFWFSNAESRYLFKLNRSQAEDATGEDWSEKVASELCDLLGLPHAQYEFATWKGQHGIASLSFVPPGGRLVAGNEVLVRLDKGYPKEEFYKVRQHTLRLVLSIIRRDIIQPPLNWHSFTNVESAVDVFVGYLMLDAWIANQDRHHENWGFIVSSERRIHLAPTFDHASSLGWNETDSTRLERLTTKDARRAIAWYVEKALSALFSSPASSKPMATLDVFKEAARLRPPAAKAWLDRLSQISDDNVRGIFDQIPVDRISDAGRRFAMKMLGLNQKRLLRLEVK